jgi:uncharacterized protein (TIGR03382 family)
MSQAQSTTPSTAPAENRPAEPASRLSGGVTPIIVLLLVVVAVVTWRRRRAR